MEQTMKKWTQALRRLTRPRRTAHRPARRVLASALAACLMLTLLPTAALAAEGSLESGLIAEFAPLEGTQVYRPQGTPEAELGLPEALLTTAYAVDADTITEQSQSVAIEVNWISDPAYDTQAEAGADFLFTPVLPDGWTLMNGVELPTVTVTMTAPLTITIQPENQEAAENETVTFEIEAEGQSLSYQWQRGLPGPGADFTFDRAAADSEAFTWADIAGAGGAAYSFTATLEDLYDARYRCVVFDGVGAVLSDEVFVSEAVKNGTKETAVYWSDEGARASSFADGSGDGSSENQAYLISTPAQLGYMAYCLSSDYATYKDKSYKLTGNIDLNGYKWTPVGSSSAAFMGTFDGGDFSITNMQINVDGGAATDRFAGLFGRIYNATVKNVTIGDGSTVTAHYTGNTGPIGYGAVAGDAYGTSTIESCHSSASVTVTFINDMLYAYVGGVVGYLEKGTVKNCSNSGEIGGTSVIAAGVAGGSGNASSGTIQNCWNTGNIAVDGTSSYAGGIVGDNYHSDSKVENCYNIGDIEGKKDMSYYGGVTGSNSGTVKNCYNSGVLTLPNSNRMSAGGVIGDNGYGSLVNSYWRKDTGVNETLSAVGSSGTETGVLSFGNDGTFASGGTVTIGSSDYSSLLPALSAWVETQGTGYWFWSGPAAAPTLTKDPPPATYAVTVNVNKDGSSWVNHGKAFKLVSGSTAVTNLNSVVDGTYDVYTGDTKTGVDVTVNGGAASVTVNYYTVTFYDGDTAYPSGAQVPQVVLNNGRASKPADNPIKENYVFDKWVTAVGGNDEFDFTNTAITSATSVYAKWTHDTSTEVSVTLTVNKDGPYYNGDSLLLTAVVANIATQAPVTVGTVQFYKGNTPLGSAVSYVSDSGFYISVVCGETSNFPYLAVGENAIKAVYTPASGTTVDSESKTLTVSDKKNGNAYVGAMTVNGLSASSSGVVPVQFTVINNGADIGITAEQFIVTGTKDSQTFTDFTVTYNEAKTIAYVHVTQPGSYEFTATLQNNTYAATETASAVVVPSYTITFNANGGNSLTPSTAQTGADGKLSSLPTPTRSGSYSFDGWYTAATGGDRVTTDTPFTQNTEIFAHWTYTGGSGGSNGGSNTTTSTTTNPDGSTTTTTTNKTTGTVTETTKAKDGTETVVETKKDGSKKETVTTPDGTRTETATTAQGNMTYTERRTDGTKISADIPKSGGATATVHLSSNTTAPVVASFPVIDGTVVLRVLPDGTEEPVAYSLVEGGKVYVRLDGDAELRVETRAGLFDDMAGHWAEEYADFTGARELFQGTAPHTFNPEQSMTRAMLATVLYRMDGMPATGEAPFSDVNNEAWYADGVAWVAENGIAAGTGGGQFGAGRSITRQELAVMLWNYAKYGGIDVTVGEDTNILSFTDIDKAGEWAIPALQWACGAGIVQGGTDGTLNPTGSATRAQVAAMLERFIATAVK